ncbi:MAG TPA: protein kinase [Polyangiaceae bacterium]|nr:protein kinase [Polyangiaceae bacterium]
MMSSDDMLGRMVLGRYRIVRALARGGMGMIYLGRVEGAAGFAKPVVVKTVIPHLNADSHMGAMLIREARILSNLQHPNIVAVLDFGQVGDAYVMVLEYVHGYHLGQWVRYLSAKERRLDVDHAVHIATHVLDALHYAHRIKRPDGIGLGIVHRDVSPANILIDIQGQVKLHDFGIARMHEESAEYKTQEGTFKGTLPFAAPETIQGVPASPSSDVYSCGVVLYQMLAGKNPFKGAQANETLHRVLTLNAPPLSAVREDVPPEVDEAVAKALAKTPEERFASAAEFIEALRAGRTRSEEQIVEEFAALVSHDFQGEVSDLLELESLDSRDRAWREAQDGPPTGRISLSSSPPGAPSNPPTTPGAALPGAQPSMQTQIFPTTAGGDAMPQRRRALLWLAVIGVLALTAGVALALVRRPTTPQNSTRFLVIEKQSSENAGEAPAETASASANLAPSAASAPELPSAATASATAATTTSKPGGGGGGDAAGLSRAFQRQQGRIEQCFQTHTKDVEGQPRIAVRFSIDKAGAVQNAELTPATLSGTPLGACILTAARGTQFGAQSEALTFTIPITARRSK